MPNRQRGRPVRTKAAIRSIDKETNGHFEFTMKEGEKVFDVGVKADGTLIDI